MDVFLVIRDAEETIRWMNVTRYLKQRADKRSRQIVFDGEKLDAMAVWRLWDTFFNPGAANSTPQSARRQRAIARNA